MIAAFVFAMWGLPVAEVLEVLNDQISDVARARSLARFHAREERWRTEKAPHLFSMVLGRMADMDSRSLTVLYLVAVGTLLPPVTSAPVP